MPGLSRICHPFPAILYAEPPRNRRAEPSRSFRVGFDPRIFSFPAHTLISISPLTPASFFALLLFSLFTLMPAFALISDFPPIPPRFFRLYSCFRPLPLYRIRSYFRFSPNPVPLSSGFTPVFVLHPYTRIRSYFRFSPNPAPLLPALLLFSSFTLIPAFALISDFPPIPPRFFRLYSCFRFRTPVFTSSAFAFPCSIPHPYPYPFSFPLPLPLPLPLSLLPGFFRFLSLKKSLINFPLANGRQFL